MRAIVDWGWRDWHSLSDNLTHSTVDIDKTSCLFTHQVGICSFHFDHFDVELRIVCNCYVNVIRTNAVTNSGWNTSKDNARTLDNQFMTKWRLAASWRSSCPPIYQSTSQIRCGRSAISHFGHIVSGSTYLASVSSFVFFSHAIGFLCRNSVQFVSHVRCSVVHRELLALSYICPTPALFTVQMSLTNTSSASGKVMKAAGHEMKSEGSVKLQITA